MSLRNREHGAMMVIIAFSLVILAVLALGGMTLGRLVIARHEAQRAADAAVLAATGAIRSLGLPFSVEKQSYAEQIARANSRQQLAFSWTVNETPDRVEIGCSVTAHLAAPSLIWKSGGMDVTVGAVGGTVQKTLTQAEKKYPKMVIVADFSNSMFARGMGGATPPPTSFDTLKKVTNDLMDLKYEFQYGLVLFADGVKASLPIALDNYQQLKTTFNAQYDCPSDPGCTTHSWEALDKAYQLLDQSPGDESWNVIFVSDGEPTGASNATDLTIQSAHKLWDRGAWVFTVHVVNATGSYADGLKKFMLKLSGSAESPEDPGFYADASSEAELLKKFKVFLAGLACQVAISPAPPDSKRMHVFIKAAGGEEMVVADSTKANPAAVSVGDLWNDDKAFSTGNYFFYRADKGLIYVTPPICDRIRDNHEPLVVRDSPGHLTQ